MKKTVQFLFGILLSFHSMAQVPQDNRSIMRPASGRNTGNARDTVDIHDFELLRNYDYLKDRGASTQRLIPLSDTLRHLYAGPRQYRISLLNRDDVFAGQKWGFALLGGGYSYLPELLSADVNVPTQADYASGVGGRFILYPNSRLGVVISPFFTAIGLHTMEPVSNQKIEDIQIRIVQIPAEVRLSIFLARNRKSSLYFQGGPSLVLPVSFQYKNYYSNTTDNQVNTLRTTMGLQGTLGFERRIKQHLGMQVEFFYGRVTNLFNAAATISSSKVVEAKDIRLGYTQLGVQIGLRIW